MSDKHTLPITAAFDEGGLINDVVFLGALFLLVMLVFLLALCQHDNVKSNIYCYVNKFIVLLVTVIVVKVDID